MAEPSKSLISALRETARRLSEGAPYQWTHQGKCNCGHLVQTILGLGAAEIHRRGLQKPGEWTEHANDYCPVSQHPVDQLIHVLREFGLNPADLAHLEYLTDPNVIKQIPFNRRPLRKNHRDDVVLYLEKWADALEQQLPATSSRNTSVIDSELLFSLIGDH